MFMHNFMFSLKTLFKNRPLIFWTFLFPVILGTLFSLAFSNIEESEKLDFIPIAIVSENERDLVSQILSKMGNKDDDDRIFDISFVSLQEADKMLEDESIDGYYVSSDEPKIVVLRSGINETVFKAVVSEIYQSANIVNNLLESNSDLNVNDVYLSVMEKISSENLLIVDKSSDKLSYTMIEFYTLIAMTCLYAGVLSMYSINQKLPNMSDNGKRVSVSPVSKFRLLVSSLVASYVTQLVGLLILFLFTIFVLDVDYGDNLLLVILLSLVGSFAGLFLGTLVASIFKSNENMKISIIIGFTMFCSFLSGMMGITMKYVIDKNVPILNIINPANMITDGFYSLYYYDTLDRFYFNLFSLVVFSIVLIVISVLCLRRQKYDSI